MRHYNATQAAKIIGISDKTIRRWLQSGKIKAKRTASNQLAIGETEVERLRVETLQERALFQPYGQLLDETSHVQSSRDNDRDETSHLDTTGRLDMTGLPVFF